MSATPADLRCFPHPPVSILFARFEGDLPSFLEGIHAIETLQPGDKVMICEACTHHPIGDDIGRVKIPRWLQQEEGGVVWRRGRSRGPAVWALRAGSRAGDVHEELAGRRVGRGGHFGRKAEELSAAGEAGASAAVDEDAAVADALAALGEGVEEKAAEELLGGHGGGLDAVLVAAVAVAEGDAAVFDGEEAVVGDGDAVGAAARTARSTFSRHGDPE